MRRWCLLLLALGCGDVDAVLELDLGLPVDGDRVAVVQARRGSVGFEDAWDASGSVSFPLSVAEARSVSIVSDGAYEEPLLVRIRYCSNAACDALGDERAPESRLRIERAFYLGERTFARWDVATVPTDAMPTPDELDRCAVRGCREGVAANYCRTDGTHFCE